MDGRSQTVMGLRIGRSTLGIALSAIAFAGVFPAVFAAAARAVDRLLVLPQLFGAPLSSILTAAFWLIGAFWIFWAYSYLLFVGGGSPVEIFGLALDPTKQLVTTGPYAYCRNPMIFGLFWVLAGVALMLRSIGGLILIPVLVILVIIYLKKFEEPGLERRFGEAYDHYRRHVPLLFPRLASYVHPDALQPGS